MSSSTTLHDIKSIKVKVFQHSTFFNTHLTLIDADGHQYEFSVLSSKQIAIEHDPMMVIVSQKEAA